MLIPLLAVLLQAPTPGIPATDPPSRVARISYLDGTVSFQPSGDTAWSDATLNYTATTGDRLYTDQNARAELQVGAFSLRLSDATDLTVTNLTDQFMQLGLAQGTLIVRVYQLSAGDSVEIDTPNGALTLVDSGEYRIDVSASDSTTTIAIRRGSLVVDGGDPSPVVRAGQSVQLMGTDPIQISDLTLPAPDGFDRWSADRDHRTEASTSAQYVGRDVPGYEELDGNGTWDQDAQYGPVWYPTVVDAGWAPYRTGHWAWIEPWGWTWVEDESWGYAPFHYGRWVYRRERWGWIPGRIGPRPCYAPALVAFVNVGGVGVQAWIPLGPEEPYYPPYHHGPEYRMRVNEAYVSNTVIITQRSRDASTTHYVNRGNGITAVSATTFRGGFPISRREVHLGNDQITRARIAPHPGIGPLISAEGGGRPASRPPLINRPVITAFGANRPVLRRNPEPAAVDNRVLTPRNPIVRQAYPKPLMARTPPPPQNLPFGTRQKAMQPDPGRPLEPQQVQNLRNGRPAGPPRDKETLPHPTLRPAPRPAPPPKPAPKPAPKPDRRP
jgi:hypothetical protein